MKNKIIFALNMSLALSLALPAFASSPELNGTLIDRTIVVTPKNLDKILFGNNIDITKAMAQVLRAKQSVNAARADLLPSLNLNFIQAISATPTFLVNFASCLVPFLFPSKWYALKQADKSYASDITGLEITRLNTYAMALNVLVHVKGDEQVMETVAQTVAGIDEYVKGLEVQSKIGLMPRADVLRGTIEHGRLAADYIKIGETLADEHAALRKMLGFNIEQKFTIELGDEIPSIYEDMLPTNPVLTKMLMRAPERTQLDFLKEAAEAGVGNARWAFLGGCSGQAGTASSVAGGSAFTVTASATLSLGFGYFPTIALAKRNVKDVEIRQQELGLELGRVLESALADIAGEKTRITNAETSVQASEALLAEQNYLLDLGKVTVRERLDAITNLARAKTEVLSARNTLSGHRITLKRLALEGKFLKVLIQSNRDLELGTNGSPRRGD
ncbi:MAG: TolC family protein [Deltaproteobacteria bacterium]|nr:TolC family protein [Deltaproteobacteria bacterium]